MLESDFVVKCGRQRFGLNCKDCAGEDKKSCKNDCKLDTGNQCVAKGESYANNNKNILFRLINDIVLAYNINFNLF